MILFYVVYNLFNVSYTVQLVQIQLSLSPEINVNTILLRCNHSANLLIIKKKEFWLSVQRLTKFKNHFNPTSEKVKFEEFVQLGKYDTLDALWLILGILKMELHAYVLEFLSVFNIVNANQFEIIVWGLWINLID